MDTFLMPLFRCKAGFSLTELLIALLIIGEIATFTIPKVLTAQQNNQYQAMGMEAISMVSEAYHIHTLKNGKSPNVGGANLSQYMNYVAVDSVSDIDYMQTQGSISCSTAGNVCLRLHNGGMLLYQTKTIGGTASTNGVWFLLDPDGKYSGTTNGPGKGLLFWIYYSGRVATKATELGPSCDSGGCGSGNNPSYQPSWFNW